MKKIILLVSICLSTHIYSLGAEPNPDKFIESKILTGKFVGTIMGDYGHLIFKSKDGKEESFFLSDIREVCFLDAMKGKMITIKYDLIERYFPEGGDYYPAQVIRSMRTKKTDFQTWLKLEHKHNQNLCEEVFNKYLVQEE